MRLRRFEPEDVAHGHGFTQALRWPHRAEDWAHMQRLGQGFVAEDEAGVAGTALWWACGERHATLGGVIVANDRQGQGVGRLLMDAILDDIGDRAILLVATDAGAPLYRKLGFADAAPVAQYHGTWTALARPHPAIRPATPADHASIRALDAATFGADRAAILAPFLAEGTAVMLEGQGGFALRRPFGRGSVIGPIVAPDEDSAIALATALAEPGAFIRIDITGDAPRLAATLEAAGLACVDRIREMRRGAWSTDQGARRFSLISQAYG